ncbi:diguanylate cyclase [Altererythrobacter aerius]|uniref:diguanylate cyclase n=1 Tax=Tsuneonella aeria TaxID=1837929 RepID=A0A6I4TEN0_9SPHN|nr:sensor domain-containing diguanylate cyclase [Tsuneonella aeria]MXO74635.1 diguanylate cyclase [Tsuneonella aeria]
MRTDRRGRIVHAVAGYTTPDQAWPENPRGRHLLDLIHPSYADFVVAEHAAALAGKPGSGWMEVLVNRPDGTAEAMELRLGGLPGATGAVGILRSIADRRALEDRLFAVTMTDPLTRLTNRGAFVRMLAHLLEDGAAGHLALFDLDHFRAVNLRHGHSGGDRVLVAFARLLRALLQPDDILSRIDGGTFGVLLPEAGAEQASAACRRVIDEIGSMNLGLRDSHRLTASAGLAPFGGDADTCLRAAELALLTAKSRGRNRLEWATPPRQSAA